MKQLSSDGAAPIALHIVRRTNYCDIWVTRPSSRRQFLTTIAAASATAVATRFCVAKEATKDDIFWGFDKEQQVALAPDLARALAAFLRNTFRPFVPDSAAGAVDNYCNYCEEIAKLSKDRRAVALKHFTQEGLLPKVFNIQMQRWPRTGSRKYGIGNQQFEPFPLNACELIGMHQLDGPPGADGKPIGQFGFPTDLRGGYQAYRQPFELLNHLYADANFKAFTPKEFQYAVPLIDPIKGTVYTGFYLKRDGKPAFLTTWQPS